MDPCRVVLSLLIASTLLDQRTITQSAKVVTGPVTFLNLPYNGYVAADATVGSPVHQLNSKGDLVPLVVQISNAPEKTRSFSLTFISGETKKFKIDDNAGNVTLNASNPAVNTTTTFTVFGIRRGVVGVSDHAFTTTLLTVNVVVTLNKHSPQFSNSSYSRSVAYGMSAGHVILTTKATDADNGTSGELVYSILSGNDEGLFSLDGKTGVLTLQRKIPDKSVRQYNLVVRATDKGTPVRNGTASVLVEIHVPTTAAPTTTLLATTSRPTTAAPSTVTPTTAAETTRPSTTSASAVVTGPVKFLNLPYNGYVAKDATIGSPVYRLNSKGDLVALVAQISNAPENTRYFSLTGISGEIDKFQIDNSAGDVSLKTANLTANTTTTFTVFGIRRGVVGVSDHAFTTTQLTVNVVLTLNKHAPRFSKAPYSGSVSYGAAAGHVILTVTATDADQGKSGELTYNIMSGNNAGLFSLDGKSGKITLRKKIPDKSAKKYNLVIKATDKGTPVRSGTATVLVEIYVPTTAAPTTTLLATTRKTTTAVPSTAAPTTANPTTAVETTRQSTTSEPTTMPPTTSPRTTRGASTQAISTTATAAATTEFVTSEGHTTEGVTTAAPSTPMATTLQVTTQPITTEETVTTTAPTTAALPTTKVATTKLVTTESATTSAPTTTSRSTTVTTIESSTTSLPTTRKTTPIPTTEAVTTTLTTTEGTTNPAPTTSKTTPILTIEATTPILTTEATTTKVMTTEGITTAAPTTSKTTHILTTEAATTTLTTTESTTTPAPSTSKMTPILTTEAATTRVMTTKGTTTAAPTTSKTTPILTTEAGTNTLTTTEGTTTFAPTTTGIPTTKATTTKAHTTDGTTKAATTTLTTTEGTTTPAPSTSKTAPILTTEAAITRVTATEGTTTSAPTVSGTAPHIRTGVQTTSFLVTTKLLTTKSVTTKLLTTEATLSTTEGPTTRVSTTTRITSYPTIKAQTTSPPVTTGLLTTDSVTTELLATESLTTLPPSTKSSTILVTSKVPQTTVTASTTNSKANPSTQLPVTDETTTAQLPPTTSAPSTTRKTVTSSFPQTGTTAETGAAAQRTESVQAIEDTTSVDALPLWALVLIPVNFVIVVLGFALLIFFKCKKRLRQVDGSYHHMRGKPNSFLDGWLTTQLDYLSRASKDGPAPCVRDDYEQHTAFFGEPWELHNRVRDVEIEHGYSNGPSRRSSARSSRTPSRKNSRKDSNRSQGRGGSTRYFRDDEQLEYVGEWSEVIGSRLTDETITSPLTGSPSSDLWQDNSLYVPTESTPAGNGMRADFSGAYSNMMSQEEPNGYPETGVQYGSLHGATPDQSRVPDAWQEFEYRPTLTRIVEEPDEEPMGETHPRKLAFISGTASDRRSKRSQRAPFTPSVDYLDEYESSTDELSDGTDSEDRRNPYYAHTQSTSPGTRDGSTTSFGLGSNDTSDNEKELRSRKDSSLVADALTWQPPTRKLSLREALDSWHTGQEEDCSHL